MTMPITAVMDDREFMQFAVNFETNIPKLNTNTVRGAATRYRNRLRKAIKARRHYASGYLYRSVRVKRTGPKAYSVVAAGYLRALETGTRPHFIPRTTKAVIWANRHGMSFKTMKAIIAERGTKPHPFTYEVLYHTLHEIEKDMNKRMERFLKTNGIAT